MYVEFELFLCYLFLYEPQKYQSFTNNTFEYQSYQTQDVLKVKKNHSSFYGTKGLMLVIRLPNNCPHQHNIIRGTLLDLDTQRFEQQTSERSLIKKRNHQEGILIPNSFFQGSQLCNCIFCFPPPHTLLLFGFSTYQRLCNCYSNHNEKIKARRRKS